MGVDVEQPGVSPEAQPRKARLRLSDAQFSLLLLSPALIILVFTVLYPLLRGIYLGFQEFSLMNLTAGPRFIAFQNFKTLLTSPDYRDVWSTTLMFVAGSVGGQFLLGFLTALVLNQEIKQRNLFRGILLTPWIVPTVVAALLWKWIYNQQYGIFNYLLYILGIISDFKAWIGDPNLALFSVTTSMVWKGFPFHMIILLAALQTIPHEITEAAIIDGTSTLQRFRYITLPLLRYIIMIDLLISIIFTFQQFTLIWTMTEGGPITATTTLAISIYRIAFQSFDFGLAAAIGTIWLMVLIIFTVLFVRIVGGGTRTSL